MHFNRARLAMRSAALKGNQGWRGTAICLAEVANQSQRNRNEKSGKEMMRWDCRETEEEIRPVLGTQRERGSESGRASRHCV